ncbi:Protein mom-2 [Frankliniella fusca]|uniref:Protein mom-2 n=1 Tax=Frankliniella fusca TaxID=407009 RepID=A0AAE1HCI8_9NEOP|nr:Protein mom-2 [Frankliniella fusca]
MDKFVRKKAREESTEDNVEVLSDDKEERRINAFEKKISEQGVTEGRVTPSKNQIQPKMKKQASRLERAQSELLASCESCPEGFRQSEIPEYYAVLNEHDLVIKENEDLRSFVKYLTDKISSLHNGDENIAIISDMPKLLQALVQCHKDNNDKKTKRMALQSKNLPLPVLSTVAAHAEKTTNHIVEGEFRFPELVQYLEDRKLGKEIWLSEDGTRIKVQVQYDTRTNQLVGLVPQLDRNGLPKVSSFVADSAENTRQLQAATTRAMANLINIVGI